MHTTVEVHIPQSLCPAVGIVTDWDTLTTLIVHRGGGEWTPVGALRAGHHEVGTVPPCFTLDPSIEAALNVRLSEERQRSVNLEPLPVHEASDDAVAV